MVLLSEGVERVSRAPRIAYLAPVVLLCVLLLAAWQFYRVGSSFDKQIVLSNVAGAQRDRLIQLMNEETGMQAYAATGDAAYLNICYRSQAALSDDQRQIEKADAGFPDLRAGGYQSTVMTNGAQRYFLRELHLTKAGDRADARSGLRHGENLFNRLRAVDLNLEQSALAERDAQRAQTRRLIRDGVIGSLAFIPLIAIWLAAFGLTMRRVRSDRADARRDALTGAGNRRKALSVIQSLIRRGDESFGVIFIDLDGFKKINDVYGHAAGDAILQNVASRLKRELRTEDVVCRIGGDEFLCIISPPANAGGIEEIAQRLRPAIARAYAIDGNRFELDCSVGVSVYPNDGKDAHVLLARADRAMYSAKASGGGVRLAAAH